MNDRKYAFLFPGQGSQKVGMGKPWADAREEARRVFEEADDVLGFPLSQLCWEGPEADLNLTVNTQPALLTTSIAVFRALGALAPELQPVAMAGHSLGEYSALVAAGALSFADALRLVRKRGELMQEAVPVGVGAMAAILGMDPAAIEAVAADAAQGEVCSVANLNGPGQTVIAGHKAAIERAVALARERGARKATLLAVSAPFHCSLMRPARDGMVGPLSEVEFHDPQVPVVCNADAVPVASGAAARDALIRQIDGPVRWVESIQWMEDQAGVESFVEVGVGTVLSGLTRRIVRAARTTGLADPEQLAKWMAESSAEGES